MDSRAVVLLWSLWLYIQNNLQITQGAPTPTPRPQGWDIIEKATQGGRGLVEGDIVLTDDQWKLLEADQARSTEGNRNKRAVLAPAVEERLWPDRTVPYVLDVLLSSTAVSVIMSAMESYMANTCIRFVPRTTQSNYVRFYPGAGCFSPIGMAGGQQDISIGKGCEVSGIVQHEIFHTLGRWHEQSRFDRDLYVTIARENAIEGTERNFEIISSSLSTTNGIPYDYRSIMHYSAFAFSANGQPTVIPLAAGVSLSELGQRTAMTELDIDHINLLYDCGVTVGTWSSWTSWTVCSATCNGGTQTRVRSCVEGDVCDGESSDIITCNTQTCRNSRRPSWSSWSSWSSCSESCDGGRQARTRTCLNGNTCVGVNTDFQSCNEVTCPVGSLSQWSGWSSCSSTCGAGRRYRSRNCQPDAPSCEGNLVEYEFCNVNIPCPNEPALPNTGWGAWSDCSLSCGGGRRLRHRCNDLPCATEEESCNAQSCATNLTGVTYRGCYYLTQQNGGLMSINRSLPLLSGGTDASPVVRQCGMAAHSLGLTIYGILQNVCIAGEGDNAVFNASGPSELCRFGTGGSFEGENFLAMDVYEITNVSAFTGGASVSAHFKFMASLLTVLCLLLVL